MLTSNDPLVSPVTNQELSDWLALDVNDPILTPMLLAATDAVVRRLGYDLLARDWSYTLWDWPINGSLSKPSLSRQTASLDHDIELPQAKIIRLDAVTSYGVAVTDAIPRDDSVFIPTPVGGYRYQQNADPALVFEYRAGFGETADDVPESIKAAIKVLAGFLYEQRGSCDAADAMHKSGAATLLLAYTRPSLVVIW